MHQIARRPFGRAGRRTAPGAALLFLLAFAGCAVGSGWYGGAVQGYGRAPAAPPDLAAELERLIRAQENFWSQYGTYSADLEEVGYRERPGIRVDILEAVASGYAAVASGGERGEQECALFVGSAEPPRAYVTRPELVACRGEVVN